MSQHIQPSQKRDEETIKLMRYFFRQMVAEEKTPPEQAIHYLPEYFLVWLDKKFILLDKDTVLQEAKVEEVAWDFLQEILGNAAGVLQITPLWPLISMAHRGNPKNKLKQMTSITLFTYEDGTIFPAIVDLPAAAMEGGELNDAFCAAQMYQHFTFFRELIKEHGLDALHDKYGGQYGGDYPFEVLMGSMLTIMPQLKAEVRPFIENYIRLIQRTLRPPLPPQLKAKIEALKKQKEQQELQQKKLPEGGWDA